MSLQMTACPSLTAIYAKNTCWVKMKQKFYATTFNGLENILQSERFSGETSK